MLKRIRCFFGFHKKKKIHMGLEAWAPMRVYCERCGKTLYLYFKGDS